MNIINKKSQKAKFIIYTLKIKINSVNKTVLTKGRFNYFTP